MLQLLIGCDGNRAAAGALGRGAIGAHRTSGTCSGIEFDDLTEGEWLGLAAGHVMVRVRMLMAKSLLRKPFGLRETHGLQRTSPPRAKTSVASGLLM